MFAASTPQSRLSPTWLRARAGFTLAEYIVVAVIVGALGAMSIGKLSSIQTDLTVQRSVRSAQQTLQGAFVMSARIRQPVRISFNATTMQLGVQNRAQTAYLMPRLGFGFGSGLNFLASNITFYPSTFVEVYPNGFASDTVGLTISKTIGTTTYSKHLWMSKAGLVSIK
jgi:type II secretory pathway pseudopilin PulG